MNGEKPRRHPRSVRFPTDVEEWLKKKSEDEDISISKKINRIVKKAKTEEERIEAKDA